MSDRLVVGLVLIALTVVFVASVVVTVLSRLGTRSHRAAKQTNARINSIGVKRKGDDDV